MIMTNTICVKGATDMYNYRNAIYREWILIINKPQPWCHNVIVSVHSPFWRVFGKNGFPHWMSKKNKNVFIIITCYQAPPYFNKYRLNHLTPDKLCTCRSDKSCSSYKTPSPPSNIDHKQTSAVMSQCNSFSPLVILASVWKKWFPTLDVQKK
jgi:hypothetical protein